MPPACRVVAQLDSPANLRAYTYRQAAYAVRDTGRFRLLFVLAFGSSDPDLDLNGSRMVDFADFLIFARSFNKSVD